MTAKRQPGTAKPTHYKVLAISLYTRDIELADQLVAQMKARGFTKANRSMVIRLALAQLDVEAATQKLSPQIGESSTVVP